MRKLSALILVVVFLTGCMTVRTYTIKKPRIDTDVEGNRGYLSGTPSEEVKENRLGENRTISVVEIEFGKGKKEGEKANIKDNDLAEDLFYEDEIESTEELTYQEDTISKSGVTTYVVQKNDTLQKISQKFFGTTKKWEKIYDFNKAVIKNPDKVYPGTKIVIPNLD